jgi:hypothetical protein
MKKLMMIAASMLIGGVVAVQAQDTTSFKKQDSTSMQQTPTQTQQPGSIQLRDMTALKSTEIPASLRETLQAPQYKGWDDASSKIYRNQTSDLYVVQIQDGTMTKTYRFDKNGKPIND